ncbi:lactonase family protein [Clostridium chrysemydis]|uniref:lactonase family protein n=1 Tax=Clostridium chrysemydis TaxID=2665504 RepID=UPI00188349F3|nr:beta-propeller fold lactonase family protein [Clostridium chrysemydis]
MKKIKGYIGTYTKESSNGIYSFAYDVLNNTIDLKLEYNCDNPTYLAKNNDLLVSTFTSLDSSGINMFKIKDDTLKNITSFNHRGKGPCHVSVYNNNILFSNYHENRIDKVTCLYDSIISNQIFKRDDKSNVHFHFASKIPNLNKIICTDLGNDEILILDSNTLKLINKIKLKEGKGPRHIAFNKALPIFYLITEKTFEVLVFSYDNLNIRLIESFKPSAKIKENFEGSAIKISPDNRFLYVADRKTNTILLFEIFKNGLLKKIKEYDSLNISSPRDFSISPCGNFIFIGSMLKNKISIFEISKEKGYILKNKLEFNISLPVCIVFK